MTVKRASQVNLINYCEFKGIGLIPQGDGNYKLENNHSVSIKNFYYQDFATGDQGNATDFCRNVLGMELTPAIEELLFVHYKMSGQGLPSANGRGLRKKECSYKPVRKASDNNRVLAYLTKTRGLPATLINEFIENGLLYQDSRNNCVFPCYDESRQERGAILRGTLTDKSFKPRANGSDARYGWVLKPEEESDCVLVSESVIDALSIIALYPEKPIRKNHILALGGVFYPTLETFLKANEQIKEIVLGVDNDHAGAEFLETVKEKLGAEYKIIDYRPKNKKDWNEELLAKN